MTPVSGNRRRSYRPGTWFGIVGHRALVALPPSEKHRVAAIWELVDEGAGFDVTLDALISAGLRDLPGFVLVSSDDGQTDVVIRGAAVATFTVAGEDVTVEGSSATTWVERSLQGVERMRIEVEAVAGDDEEPAPAYVVDGGLFRVSRIDETPAADDLRPVRALHVVESPGTDGFVGLSAVADAPDTDTDLEQPVEPEPQPVPEPVDEPVDEAPIWAAEEDPVTEVDVPLRSPEPPDWTPEPVLPPPPPLPPVPPTPPVSPTPPALEGVVARLVISSGDTVDVDRPTVIGRAPETKQYDDADPPRLVTVPSAHFEISSTHIEVRPGVGADEGSAVVTDLGSTNGTVVVQPGSGPQDLAPGEAVALRVGALIDIGDGITIQVTRP